MILSYVIDKRITVKIIYKIRLIAVFIIILLLKVKQLILCRAVGDDALHIGGKFWTGGDLLYVGA